MSTQAELPRTPLASTKTRPPSQPTAPAKDGKVAEPPAYWGDRLTLKFWLFCFGLMLAMHLVEALHRFVLFLMGRSPAP